MKAPPSFRWRVGAGSSHCATPAFAAALGGEQSTTLFWTGLLITLLLTAYIYAGLRRTAEIERRVGERTVPAIGSSRRKESARKSQPGLPNPVIEAFLRIPSRAFSKRRRTGGTSVPTDRWPESTGMIRSSN